MGRETDDLIVCGLGLMDMPGDGMISKRCSWWLFLRGYSVYKTEQDQYTEEGMPMRIGVAASAAEIKEAKENKASGKSPRKINGGFGAAVLSRRRDK